MRGRSHELGLNLVEGLEDGRHSLLLEIIIENTMFFEEIANIGVEGAESSDGHLF